MICKAFKNGFCPKGQHCNYAHGEQDMRAPSFYDNEAMYVIRSSPPCYQNPMLNDPNSNHFNENEGKSYQLF